MEDRFENTKGRNQESSEAAVQVRDYSGSDQDGRRGEERSGQILDMLWRDKRISGQLRYEATHKRSRIASVVVLKGRSCHLLSWEDREASSRPDGS